MEEKDSDMEHRGKKRGPPSEGERSDNSGTESGTPRQPIPLLQNVSGIPVPLPQNVDGTPGQSTTPSLSHGGEFDAFSSASGEEVAGQQPIQEFYAYTTVPTATIPTATISTDPDKIQLDQIEKVTGRTKTSVETIEELVGKVISELNTIKNFIQKAATEQAERIAKVEGAVAECRRAVDAGALKTDDEHRGMREVLDEHVKVDGEHETTQSCWRRAVGEAVGKVEGVVSKIDTAIEGMNVEEHRSRSDQWTAQLKAFLEAQRESNSTACTSERHSTQCAELFLRGVLPSARVERSTGVEVKREPVGAEVEEVDLSDDSSAGEEKMPGKSPDDKRQRTDQESTVRKTYRPPNKQPITCRDCRMTYSNLSGFRRHRKDETCGLRRAEALKWNKTGTSSDTGHRSLVARQAEPGLSTSASGSTETDSIPRSGRWQVAGGRTPCDRKSGRPYGRSLQKNCKAEDLNRCGQCGYTTQYKNNLGKHLRTQHQGKTSDAGRRAADTPGGSGTSGGPLPGGGAAAGADAPGGSGASGGPIHYFDGAVAGAEVGTGDGASGGATDGEIISSDEPGGGPEGGQGVDVKEVHNPFKRGPSQRRDHRNK